MTPKEITPQLSEITPEDLASRAILVGFHRKSWTPTARDRNVENETRDRKNYRGEARFRKYLIDTDHLTDWRSNARAAYNYHVAETLAWGDQGYRALLGAKIERYENKMEDFKSKDRQLVADLQRRWPEIIDGARLLWPDDMFFETDYPTADQVPELFGIDYSERPIPTAGDFRLAEINDAMKARMQENLEKALAASIALAVEEPWLRMADAVRRIVEEITEYLDEDSERKKFSYTMLSQLASLIAAMPGLNLTNDASLTAMCDDMIGLLRDIGVDTTDDETTRETAKKAAKGLRKDPEAAKATVAKAKDALDKMAGFMGGGA